MLAAFTENGPCLVPEKGADRGKAVYNPHAWNSNATVIWLDQPSGVGFSWGTENDKDEEVRLLWVGIPVHTLEEMRTPAQPRR